MTKNQNPIPTISIILDDERTLEEHRSYLSQYIQNEILDNPSTIFVKTPNEFWDLWNKHLKGELKIEVISFDNDLGLNPENGEPYQEGSAILRQLLWTDKQIDELQDIKILVHTANNQARQSFISLTQSLAKMK